MEIHYLLDDSTASNSDALIGASSLRADLIGGVPKNAKLGTNADGLFSIAPKYSTLFTSPKIIAHQFEFSELAMEMAQIDDGIGDIRAQMREDMGKHHAEVQNQMLVMPLEAYDFDGGISSSVGTIERNYTSTKDCFKQRRTTKHESKRFDCQRNI